jgi:hypothetical protein
MLMPATLPDHVQTRFCLIPLILTLVLSACTTTGAILKVRPQHIEGTQYPPQEITRMLESLGYEQLPVRDPTTGQPVYVAEKYGEYRLLFQSSDDNNVRVNAHIGTGGGNIGLHLYVIDSKDLDKSAVQLYRKLKQRLELEYGAENISDSYSALSP